jgi:hypothetical protein
MVFLDKKRWSEVFSGYEIVDVAIQDCNILQFCTRKRIPHEEASHLFDHDIPTRLIALFTDRAAGENCGYKDLVGMAFPKAGVSRKPFGFPGGLIASFNEDGAVWPRGSGLSGPLECITNGQRPGPGTRRLKCINGYTYSVGVFRKIYKRVNVGDWIPVNEGFPEVEAATEFGFNDMDAFSESDMYAVGGNGDVWHFNGTRWQQMGFPSNVQLATVTCAGDGNVYISGEGGSLWVGGKSTWKPVYTGSSSIMWNDILWFQDKLWLASDYQLRQLNGKGLTEVMHEGKPIPMNGHMDVYGGLLAIASPECVRSFDGTSWRKLVEPYLD